MSAPRRVSVIGGGIVGLAVADRLLTEHPDTAVTVVEKESDWAQHQTGRNSGVIHSGLYYRPGSAKAVMCRRGAEQMFDFAAAHGIPHERCGKLVVATSDEELPQLRALADRGRQNGLQVREITPEQAREYEPHVTCVAALHVPETGIIDYSAVCAALVDRLAARGADLRLQTSVVGIATGTDVISVETDRGPLPADRVVNCAGLYSDVIARMGGIEPSARIVPFRGEYFELVADREYLVNGLIYPVPDPMFPFLGVHLTKMVHGGVHAGPNAVLALAREGYRWRDVRVRELAGTLGYRGFWRLAGKHAKAGMAEMARSASRHRFAESLRGLVPAVRDRDLVPAPAGVRAQAIKPDGSLVDDFLIERAGRMVNVINAPSPAATSAFAIAEHIERELSD